MDENQDFNPFEEFSTGGGLWDGKVVTVIGASFKIDRLAYKDGSPVIDERTGQPSVRNVLEIVGIAEGEEKERRETYSIGGNIPTADGEGFQKADGTPGKLHENTEAAKFFRDLRAGGYDMASLYDKDTHRAHIGRLKGARILFKAVPKLDKDGKVKMSKDGKYEQNSFLPSKYVGTTDVPGAKKANGAASEVKEKAAGLVLSLLADAGGRMTRADLVRKMSAALAKDKDSSAIIGLIVREDFHKGQPWTYSGTEIAL